MNLNNPFLTEEQSIEFANAFFSVYENLDELFAEYGFSRKENKIMWNHETPPRAFFRMTEEIGRYKQAEAFRVECFIGVMMPPEDWRYRVDSIHVIVYRDVGVGNKTISIPIFSEKHVDPPFPSKAEILARVCQIVPEIENASKRRIEIIQSRLGLNSETNEVFRDQGVSRRRSI